MNMFNRMKRQDVRDIARKTEAGPPLIFLQPSLRLVFQPRPLPDALPVAPKRACVPLNGITDMMSEFEVTDAPKRVCDETPSDSRKRLRREKQEAHDRELEVLRESYKPKERGFPSDAFKTIFAYNVDYSTTDSRLRDVFSHYGTVKSITKPSEGKGRGYAFVEFESETDFQSVYRKGEIRIDGRYVKLDVERGRTVKNWYPRRLGGGKGG